MGVAAHLKIELTEYDERIRTFVPHYERMIEAIAGAFRLQSNAAPTIVDLGIGTGALAAACLRVCPAARLIGIDADAGMLDSARARLASCDNLDLRVQSFLDSPLPPCDAFVACIALHHIRDAQEKQAFYMTCTAALKPGGLLISGDCYTARDERMRSAQMEAWLAHLQQTYTRAEAEDFLAAWAGEDTYFPLADELEWMSNAGLAAEVVWRADGFAVIAGRRAGA